MVAKQLTTVHHAFDILDWLIKHEEATPSDLADSLEMPISTLHGYLTTLNDRGLVEKTTDGYRVTSQLLEMGARARENMDLFQVAKPIVDDLADETGETVGLVRAEGYYRVILYHVQANDQLDFDPPLGNKRLLHLATSGLVILAGQSEDQFESTLQEISKTNPPEFDIENVRKRVSDIRDEKLPVFDRYWEQGVWVAATPIRTDERVHGSVVLLAPKNRVSQSEQQEEMKTKLLDACNLIEINLSKIPPSV